MDFVAHFEYIRTVKPGDKFRDWLVEVLGDRIKDKDCEVRIFKLSHASHRVCKYEFKGEKLSVLAKFFALPTGKIKNKDFRYALVSKYVPGRRLFWYFKHRKVLKEKLELIANMLRRLHDP